jgi:acetate kinase
MNPPERPAPSSTAVPHYLTLNAGSSSLKGALYGTDLAGIILSGQVDRIGPDASMVLSAGPGHRLEVEHADMRTHHAAFDAMITALCTHQPSLRLKAIAHRVVHGGARYARPVIVDDRILADLRALEPFAPLHQPHNLMGIHRAAQAFPGVPQIACFDTGFHQGHSQINDLFALPYRYYEQGIRRYGFHGLSYEYIAGELKRVAPQRAGGRVLVAHLGHGASMCAMRGGVSVASSMGFSALDGLPMGTRCGQIDPGVLLYMMAHEHLAPERIRDILYTESGLLGLSEGLSSDMRTLEAADTEPARRAIAYFVDRVQREIGALAATLGGIETLVFCGGIGEHSSSIRAQICEGLGWMGIQLVASDNNAHHRVISSPEARICVMVIPTHEEQVMVRAARRLVGGARDLDLDQK